MRIINLKITSEGFLESNNLKAPIHLGTKGEVGEVSLTFDTSEANIDGLRYKALKWFNKDRSILQIISSLSEVVVDRRVLEVPGIWKLSFVASSTPISETYQSSVEHLAITAPIDFSVKDGILDLVIPSEEERINDLIQEVDYLKNQIRKVFSDDNEDLEIPDEAVDIQDYFYYKSPRYVNFVSFGKNTHSLGAYSFSNTTFERLDFISSTNLEIIEDHVFSFVTNVLGGASETITIPSSVNFYGPYVFHKSTLGEILRFKENSNLRAFVANSFNTVYFKRIELPDNLTAICESVTAYVFRDCPNLESVWIPNTLTKTIHQQYFAGCPSLTSIELQDGFNVSIDLCNLTNLTAESIVSIFNALADRRGQNSLNLALGSFNLAKVTDEQKQIALNKNWTLS